MPRESAASVARTAVPAEDIRAGERLAGGIRCGVRSDVSPVRVDAIAEPLLLTSLCYPVLVRREASALAVST